MKSDFRDRFRDYWLIHQNYFLRSYWWAAGQAVLCTRESPCYLPNQKPKPGQSQRRTAPWKWNDFGLIMFDIWFVSRGKLLEGTKIWFQATEIVLPSSIFRTWEDSGLDWSWLGTHLLDTTAWFAFCDILRLQTPRQMHGLLGESWWRVVTCFQTRKYCVIDNACPDQPPVDYSSPVSMNLDAACQTRFSMIFLNSVRYVCINVL